MFAIFEIGGKQYKVSEGDIVYLEKLNAQEGETVKEQERLSVKEIIITPKGEKSYEILNVQFI